MAPKAASSASATTVTIVCSLPQHCNVVPAHTAGTAAGSASVDGGGDAAGNAGVGVRSRAPHSIVRSSVVDTGSSSTVVDSSSCTRSICTNTMPQPQLTERTGIATSTIDCNELHTSQHAYSTIRSCSTVPASEPARALRLTFACQDVAVAV
jgi:hypothetical protein